MAERRMFAKTIIDSDAFLDMPMSTQLLYFHLSMRADDEGFLNNPKKIQMMIGASEDDLKLLMLKKFIISFDTGVVVIKHWRINNYLQKDRCKPTIYQKEKSMLGVKENKSYTLNFDDPKTKKLEDSSKVCTERIQNVSSSDTDCIQVVYNSDTDCIHDQNSQKFESRMNTDENAMYTDCIQDVYSLDTQVRLGKVRLGKNSLGKYRLGYVCESSETDSQTELQTEPDQTVINNIVLEKWNALQDIGIEKIKYIGAKREEKLKSLLNEFGLSSFDDAIDAIRESDFLQGKKEGYAWKIDFDWLIEPNHYSAVIEGSYRDYNPFPSAQGKSRPRNFVQMQNHEENWPELEEQLLDN